MIDKLVSRLLENGLYLSKEGDKLNVEYNGNLISDDLLEEIKNNKDELLRYLAVENSDQDYDDIVSLKNPGPFELSSAQRRLWVLSQFEDGSVAYNIPGSIYLNEDIDIDYFKRAIDSTIERHEILRTVFKEDETGEIRQWVLKREDLGFTIDYIDYRKEKKKEEKVKNYIAEDSYKSFDLEKGPLLRACLIRVEEEEYVFYYNMHHIISDGWSMEVLSKDVFSYYEAYKENKQPDLKELRIQYKDYSAWQLSQLKEESCKEHRAYWLNSLNGELPLLDLRGTKQRPRIKTHHGRTLGTYLNKEVSRKLKAYSQARGGTVFMGLLASLNVILYRYSGQDDLIIGSPIAGREHADLESQIGFYVNTLALRNKIKPEENFDELFSRIKQNTLNAYFHQMYPFDKVVEELDLARDTSRSAVFDVMLVLQNNGENTQGSDPISIGLKEGQEDQIVDHGSKTSKFDILINVQEQGDYLSFSVEYNTDVYEREMIEGFIVHFKALLSKLLSDPKQALGRIDYLSGEERKKLTFSFNDTKVDYGEKTVMELFEEQVAKTPDKVALIFEGKELTYRELNERSNALAHILKKQYKASNTTKVGVMLERSLESVISLIGVMKTGACYVPIDHDYPTERVAYILKDSGLEVIISAEELWKKHGIKESSLIDIKKLDLKKGKNSNPEATNNLNDGSYVIYTSGSTGKPKGVLQSHRMMSNLIQWDIHRSGIERNLKHLQYTSFSFDVSLQDCWSALNSGGSIYIANEKIRADFSALWIYIFNNGIQVLSFPFSAFQQLIIQNSDQNLRALQIKHIVCSGEQLIINSSLQKFLENNPNVELHNHYGPSESHVVTSYTMSSTMGNIETRSPIGKSISNSSIYILDAYYNLVPQGVEGELYIGGDNLAIGYLNKEELTKERFIDSVFDTGKLYKTGDQGYWRSDGNIEFIGRKDDQVKIRGYRIELGEIEHALQSHKAIDEAVVLARENQNKEKELVAYITAKAEQNTSELRSYLKEILPEYMLPACYVQLEALPLTGNGKIDRKALPDPQGLGLSSGVEYVAPGNETEEKLVKIWQEILQRENIGAKDNFFELGGHSIKTIRVNKQYKLILDKKVPLNFFISNPTIREHAEYMTISMNESMENNEELIKLNTFSKNNKNMIMIPPIQGQSIYFMGFSKFIENKYNCYSINYGIDHGFKSLTELSRYYAELIKHSFNQTTTLYILGFSMGVSIAFEIVKILEGQNYNCELFLVDRIPNSKSFLKEMEKSNSDNKGIWFEQQVSIASKISPEESLTLIRKRISTNYETVNNYTTTGTVKSNISCLEGFTSRLPFNMKLWKKHTNGQFRLEKIESTHDEIFNRENYEKLYDFIQKNKIYRRFFDMKFFDLL